MSFLLLLAACKHGDSDSNADTDVTTDTSDPATVPLTGACPMAADQGGFVVQAGGDANGVKGSVADGVVPVTVLTEIGNEGGCLLLRQENPRCEPACAAGEACGLDGVCVPYPRNQDLGTVTIGGLVAPVSMDPVFPGNTYFNTSLADPPFSPGLLVTLHMPGGTYGPATLHGVGFQPIAAQDTQWLVAGRDLEVSWSPPTGEVLRSEVGVEIHIDQHGASPASLHCTFADTGHATVPASLLSELVGVGVSGFPIGTLERRTLDHVDLAGGGCMTSR
jgi:hypothetical protein